MNVKLLGILGILLSHTGFILLYFYGSPFRALNGGVTLLRIDDPLPAELAKDASYRRRAWAGFALVTVGATLQVMSVGYS